MQEMENVHATWIDVVIEIVGLASFLCLGVAEVPAGFVLLVCLFAFVLRL